MSFVAAVACCWAVASVVPLGLPLRCEGHRMLGSEASNGGQAKRQQCADLSSDENVRMSLLTRFLEQSHFRMPIWSTSI